MTPAQGKPVQQWSKGGGNLSKGHNDVSPQHKYSMTMPTFERFLHGDGWKHPLDAPETNPQFAQIVGSGQRGKFPDFQRDAWRTTITLSPSQRLMLILAGAGPRGVSHADLAAMIDLDAKALDELLDALIRGGQVAMSMTRGGRRVYRRLI